MAGKQTYPTLKHDNAKQADTKTVTDVESKDLESALKNVLKDARFPNAATVVTGKLDDDTVVKVAEAGIEHIINLQADEELDFDEAAAAARHNIAYTHIPIDGVNDLKQLNLLKFDKALREHHGKKTLLHCKTGERVGACMALRAGWLRGRKMDTALQRGVDHGLKSLEEEVRNRLLVPR